jgi:NIPSNAP
MIFDVRTYDIAPGKLGAFVEVFGTYGKPVADKHGLQLVGFFTTRIGRLNQVLHIWQYDDLMQFEKLRAARDADPGWAIYRGKNAGMIVRQEDKIMDGAPFSPLR